MQEEDVTLDGRRVRVVMGGVEREQEYKTERAAKAAWRRLYFDRKARERFLRQRRNS